MKTFLVLFSVLLTGTAQAKVLKCESANPPRGRANLLIQTNQSQSQTVLVTFTNASGERAEGRFEAPLDPQNGYLSGDGALGGSPAHIQSDLRPNGTGSIFFSIHSADRRFDLGYGLNLSCR